jgi:hypothetical protein
MRSQFFLLLESKMSLFHTKQAVAAVKGAGEEHEPAL